MMRTRLVALGAVLLIALGACGWTQPGFDSGRSNSNPFETRLTPSNVGQLVAHVIPGPTTSFAFAPMVLTFGDLVLVGGAPSGVDAYPAAQCPRADNGPCTPRWHADGYFLATDGTSAFVTTSATTFAAIASNGTTGHQYDAAPPAGFRIADLRVTGSYLLATLEKPSPTPTVRDTQSLAVFSRSCATPTCAPERTLPLFTRYGSNYSWAAQDRILYSNESGTMNARALDTGATLWSTGADANDIRVRDGRVYATGGNVYDAAGIQGCSGTPKVCSPIRHLNGAYEVDSVSPSRAMDHVIPDGNPLPPSDIRFWRTDAAGCVGGSPVSCEPVARTATFNAISEPISTDRLAFAVSRVTFISSHYHFLAFDTAGVQGCSGSPVVCAPLIDIDFSTDVAGTPTAVAGGRVYVPTVDGAVHVFSLPGDVS